MRDANRQLQKEEAIKQAFQKHRAEKKYRDEYIYELIAAQYFLKAATVEHIVWGEYDRRRRRVAERLEAGRHGATPAAPPNAALGPV